MSNRKIASKFVRHDKDRHATAEDHGPQRETEIELGRGDDSYTLDVAAGSGKVEVDGGRGVDTLTLSLSRADWSSDAVQADLARLATALEAGQVNEIRLASLNLEIENIETVRILVDGQEVPLLTPPAVAANDTFALTENGTVSGSVIANDLLAGGFATATLLTGPAAGALTFNADGTFTFDAATGFDTLAAGQTQGVSFTYQVTDANGASATATATLTITGTNDAPVVTGSATGAVVEDGMLAASGQLSATDIDGDAVTFSGSATGAWGSFSIDATGAWGYALDNTAAQALGAGEMATEVFTVTADDGMGGVVMQDVSVTITGTADVTTAAASILGGAAIVQPLTNGTGVQLLNGGITTEYAGIFTIDIAAPGQAVSQLSVSGDFSAEGLGEPGLTFVATSANQSEYLVWNASGLSANIDLGGGNDQFQFYQQASLGAISVDAGTGTDRFSAIDNGTSANTWDFSNATAGHISLDGAAIAVAGFEGFSYQGGGDQVIGSDTSDTFVMYGAGSTRIDGGAGNDLFNMMTTTDWEASDALNGGAGNDTLIISTVVPGTLQIDASNMSAANGSLVINGETLSASNIETLNITARQTVIDVVGSSGADYAVLGMFDDRYEGGAGNDRTIMQTWTENGSDTLVFRDGFGADTVIGFNANAGLGHDVIEFNALHDASGALIDNFSAVMAHATAVGTNSAQLDFGNGDIMLLNGVTLSQLSADDFIFL